MTHIHRPTTKQQNKKFKSKHRTKGEISKRNAGRVELAQTMKKGKVRVDNRLNRKNKVKQMRENKMSSVAKNKIVGSYGKGPALNVALLSLSSSADLDSVLTKLMNSSEYEFPDDWSPSSSGVCTFQVPRYRSHLSFFKINNRDILATMDIVKVADVLLFVVDVEEGIDSTGELLMSYIRAQGIPTVMFIMQGLGNIPAKKQRAAQNYVTKECQDLVNDGEVKVLPLEKESDGLQVLRFVSQIKLKDLNWRSSRPYMLVDEVDFQQYDNSSFGTLKLTGYLRGNKLDPNNLVVIPDYGEFQLESVVLHTKTSDHQMGEDIVFNPDPSKIQTLARENIPDFDEMDQTWPTPEELAASETKTEVMVPAGFSEYQAAWIPEDEYTGSESTIDSSDDFDPDFDVEDMDLREYLQSLKDQKAQMEMEMSSEEELTDEQIRQKRIEEEQDDMEFPDEIEYDWSIPARVRFQKFRGLKSFRTTPWDPKENLPFDYAKIYQFENPQRTKKYVYKKHKGVEENNKISLYLKDVPFDMLANHPQNHPLIVSGLLRHENKMSVMNVLIRRHNDYEDPVKSKDEMVIHCGFRRFKANPIFSDHNITCDKFKYRRFLHNGVYVASFYAPITFPPSPVIAIRENKLLGTGSVLSIDPDRIILKKVVLTGDAIKFNKNRVVVKDMFSNPEDIDWFKPVEIWTKYGRTGNIRESVGTHGHMKCVFDGQLLSQDVICMSLYKRVFPKWVTLPEPRRQEEAQ
eukprot:TRINITY_DN221_c0_g1_i1.p1 TRINITY_DN221_c0_g1~~TRINITY_DN221_c0_g1_i1.p1  ORF type:complete len:744 (+),score=202.91 TRINITY_DN221_c0_g1_i1:52-2283(+)